MKRQPQTIRAGVALHRIDPDLHSRHLRHLPTKRRLRTIAARIFKTRVRHASHFGAQLLIRSNVVPDLQRVVIVRRRDQTVDDCFRGFFVCVLLVGTERVPQPQAFLILLPPDQIQSKLRPRQRVLADRFLQAFRIRAVNLPDEIELQRLKIDLGLTRDAQLRKRLIVAPAAQEQVAEIPMRTRISRRQRHRPFQRVFGLRLIARLFARRSERHPKPIIIRRQTDRFFILGDRLELLIQRQALLNSLRQPPAR